MVADAARRQPVVDARPFVPAALATLTILAQVMYPLAHGAARQRLTVVVVLLFAAASLSHALLSRGAAVAFRMLVATAGVGFAVEVIGLHTGLPFGSYRYAESLGWRLSGVPVVIALAWTMFAWPAALVAQRLSSRPAIRILIGAWALASWDLFLDPQMVAAGHWHWQSPSPHLPGVDTVPLTNYAGWLSCSLVISVALQGILRSSTGDDRWPVALFLWTYAASVLALAGFLDLGAAAGWGALGMGLVAVPLVVSLQRGRSPG